MANVADELSRWAISQLWQVTVLTLLVGVLIRLACRRRPHLAYILCMVCVLKCLTPPVWNNPLGLFTCVESKWSGTTDDELVTVEKTPASKSETHSQSVDVTSSENSISKATAPAGLDISPVSGTSDGRTTIAANLFDRPVDYSTALLAIWACGVVCSASYLIVRRVALHRLIRSAEPASNELQQLAQTLGRQISWKRPVRLLVVPTELTPCAMGVMKPTILLPTSFERSSNAGIIESVLTHELVHLRRRDPLMNVVQLAAQALWWFHPVVWWINREARRERERCCDEAVIACLGCPPVRYARNLLDVCQIGWQRRDPALLAGLSPYEVTRRRLEHVMQHSQRFFKSMPRRYWALVGVLALLLLPGAALKGPDRLSFGTVHVGSHVDAICLFQIPSSEFSGQSLSVEVPEFATLKNIEVRQPGISAPLDKRAVMVSVSLQPQAPGELRGDLKVSLGENVHRLPVGLKAVKRDPKRPKVLSTMSPFLQVGLDATPFLEPLVDFSALEKADLSYGADARQLVTRPETLSPYNTVIVEGDLLLLPNSKMVSDALKIFMENGGRVIVVANAFYQDSVGGANAIIGDYGMSLLPTEISPDTFRVDGPGIATDRLTRDVRSLEFRRVNSVKITDRQKASILVRNPYEKDEAIVAVSRVGKGELVVFPQSMWCHWMGQGGDNAQLMENLLTTRSGK